MTSCAHTILQVPFSLNIMIIFIHVDTRISRSFILPAALHHTMTIIQFIHFFHIFKRFYLFTFRERGGREEKRERNISVRLPLIRPLLGTSLATQACALTRNRTCGPLFCRLVLTPLSNTSQGSYICTVVQVQLSPFSPPPSPPPQPSLLGYLDYFLLQCNGKHPLTCYFFMCAKVFVK